MFTWAEVTICAVAINLAEQLSCQKNHCLLNLAVVSLIPAEWMIFSIFCMSFHGLAGGYIAMRDIGNQFIIIL